MSDPHPTCLVTGATSGIGRAAAIALAHQGWNICALGRHTRRGLALVSHLRQRHRDQIAEFVECDLACFESVQGAARAVVASFPRIDTLIANAGARFDRFDLSPEGIELTFATNHLGHFLLTALVWPAVAVAPFARIITVTSSAHRAARPERGWLATRETYDRRLAYAGSKLANLLFAQELGRRCSGAAVVSLAFDPGVVASRFALNNGLWPWLKHVASHGCRRQLTPVRTAGSHLANLAAHAAADTNGRLIRGTKTVEPAPVSRTPGLASHLWESSLAWCRLHPSAVATSQSPFSPFSPPALPLAPHSSPPPPPTPPTPPSESSH